MGSIKGERIMNNTVKITEITEHEDGSATLKIECEPAIFAAIVNTGFITLIKAGLELERSKDVCSSD